MFEGYRMFGPNGRENPFIHNGFSANLTTLSLSPKWTGCMAQHAASTRSTSVAIRAARRRR
jgi:hypothetical protein